MGNVESNPHLDESGGGGGLSTQNLKGSKNSKRSLQAIDGVNGVGGQQLNINNNFINRRLSADNNASAVPGVAPNVKSKGGMGERTASQNLLMALKGGKKKTATSNLKNSSFGISASRSTPTLNIGAPTALITASPATEAMPHLPTSQQRNPSTHNAISATTATVVARSSSNTSAAAAPSSSPDKGNTNIVVLHDLKTGVLTSEMPPEEEVNHLFEQFLVSCWNFIILLHPV